MAIISESFEISSCDDVELGIKRTSNLEYRISFDDTKEMKALVFIVGGYGANASIYFLDSYRNYIAKKFSVVAVQVFYHCFCQRLSDEAKYSATKRFEKEDLARLENFLRRFGFDAKVNENNALFCADSLVKHIEDLKKQGRLEPDFKLVFTSSFVPLNGDYQNFGLMAAIDHINALKHLVKIYPQFKNLPKITGGGLMVATWLYSSLKSRLGILMGLLIIQERLCLL